jgi:Ribbon-helix-helix protein, copG family
MPFQPIGDENLEAKLDIRLPAAEKERIREDAAKAGVSMSEMVRRRYFGRPIVSRADERAIAQLIKLGGLLKRVHTESGGAYSGETFAAIQALYGAAQELGKGLRAGDREAL